MRHWAEAVFAFCVSAGPAVFRCTPWIPLRVWCWSIMVALLWLNVASSETDNGFDQRRRSVATGSATASRYELDACWVVCLFVCAISQFRLFVVLEALPAL